MFIILFLDFFSFPSLVFSLFSLLLVLISKNNLYSPILNDSISFTFPSVFFTWTFHALLLHFFSILCFMTRLQKSFLTLFINFLLELLYQQDIFLLIFPPITKLILCFLFSILFFFNVSLCLTFLFLPILLSLYSFFYFEFASIFPSYSLPYFLSYLFHNKQN